MKNVIYALILPIVVISGLVLANREMKNQPAQSALPKLLSAADMKTEREKWEATPDGINFKKWEASPAGKKVYAAEAKIRSHLNDFSDMEAVVTSLTLPAGSRLGFGVMAKMDGIDYIVTFDAQKSQLEQLRSLKVNDRIIIRSRTVSHAPKYAYPIVSCEYLGRDGSMIFKRIPRKGGC